MSVFFHVEIRDACVDCFATVAEANELRDALVGFGMPATISVRAVRATPLAKIVVREGLRP